MKHKLFGVATASGQRMNSCMGCDVCVLSLSYKIRATMITAFSSVR